MLCVSWLPLPFSSPTIFAFHLSVLTFNSKLLFILTSVLHCHKCHYLLQHAWSLTSHFTLPHTSVCLIQFSLSVGFFVSCFFFFSFLNLLVLSLILVFILFSISYYFFHSHKIQIFAFKFEHCVEHRSYVAKASIWESTFRRMKDDGVQTDLQILSQQSIFPRKTFKLVIFAFVILFPYISVLLTYKITN